MLIQPVVLSGGSGTRLWPLSREAYPKQFLPLTGRDTMLQQTVRRLDATDVENPRQAVNVGNPLVVCNEAHRFLVAEQLRLMGREADSIILEPAGRNTAPALTLAALIASREAADPILIAMPADHAMRDEKAFRHAVAQAHDLAANGAVVTFGIVPTAPETGYGYIRQGDPHPGDTGTSAAFVLDAFVEKPDAETAASYVESGGYLWNSGIFLMRCSVWLELIGRFRPDIAEACRASVEQGVLDGDFFRPDRAEFEKCPGDSIDYAVMERLCGQQGMAPALVIPLQAGWSDVGAWSALWEVREQDTNGNVSDGDVYTLESRNNLLLAQDRMLAAVGVEDLIVVETPDAVLVVHRDRAQDVKRVTHHLKTAKRREYQFHRLEHRPWGDFEPIDAADRYQVKRLRVKPGASLSLQMHHHRAEHWIVVKGTARVTRGDEVFLLSENESTYIPLGVRHRLENPGTIPLEIIEVQSGSYLGEDDIVRFEDIYNRVTEPS